MSHPTTLSVAGPGPTICLSPIHCPSLLVSITWTVSACFLTGWEPPRRRQGPGPHLQHPTPRINPDPHGRLVGMFNTNKIGASAYEILW